MPQREDKDTCKLSRADELKLVASQFTKHLVVSGHVSNAPILKTRIRDLYLRYQEQRPSRIHVNEILNGLYQIHVVKKGSDWSPDNPTIQFKSTLLPSIDSRNVDEELSKPRIRVLTNQAQTFRNRAPLEPDIVGLHCRLCNVKFSSQAKCDEHEKTNEHICRSKYRNERNKLKKSLPFLEITGVKATVDVNEKKGFVASLKNVGQGVHVEVKEVFILRNENSIVPAFRVPVTLKKDEKFECHLEVCFTKYESHSYPLVVLVRNKDTMEIFHVLVESEFKVLDQSLHDLGASEPFIYPTNSGIQLIELPVVPGRPLPNKSTPPHYPVPLPHFPIPANLNRLLNRGFRIDANSEADAATMNKIKALLLDKSKERVLSNVEALDARNYTQRMKHLLWMEEHQQNMDLHLYDQKDAVLCVVPGAEKFHKLDIPGLSENRPSVLKNDELYIRQANADRKYQGVVHLVEENSALLALSPAFNYIKGEKVSVEFSLNRLTLRVCHRAVELTTKERLFSIVFPEKFYQKYTDRKFAFKNPKVEANKEQHRAVRNIVNNTAYPAPYIIYGPPGTGKTSTIVEAISQILLNVKGVKICACAPSNAAADLVALRLLDFVPSSFVYRIYSVSRSVRDIPEKLKKNCNLNGSEFVLPEFHVIASKSIIVVTPYTAAKIHGMNGRFYDYVFFDEAGHAEEPLTLLPAVGLLKQTPEGQVEGNLILAGDPKQLGPIVHSRLAAHLGLGMSMLERLMIRSSIYQRDPADHEYDDRVITKLVTNYRSHEVLLHVPNKLFYDGELKACADVAKTTALCTWETLPKKNFPIIFHGVRGSDEREKNSPSYFNLLEIQTVKQYVMDLTTTKVRGTILQQSEIVVLTPYRKQVEKFRKHFRSANLHNIEVKSVEEFQGQERKVVIISTVRSQQRFVSSDYQFGLGFLRNPKRFNVATTRAQALMIIVGNPDILQTDKYWRTLIEYCIQNGGYKGEKAKESVDQNLNPNDNFTLNLSSLTIKTEEMPESERVKFVRHE